MFWSHAKEPKINFSIRWWCFALILSIFQTLYLFHKMLDIYFFLYPEPPILRPDARPSLILSTGLRLIWRALIDIVNSIHCAIDMPRYTYIIIRVLLNQSTKITQHLLNYLTPNPKLHNKPCLPSHAIPKYKKCPLSQMGLNLFALSPSPVSYVDTETLITAIQQAVDHVFSPSPTFILV